MLTKRTFLLTISGLLLGYAAAAQAPTPAAATAPAGPQPTDILSWLAWGLAAVVLLFGIMTAISLASAAAERAQIGDATAAAPAAAEATSAAPAPVAPVAAAAPTPAVPTEQLVAA